MSASSSAAALCLLGLGLAGCAVSALLIFAKGMDKPLRFVRSEP